MKKKLLAIVLVLSMVFAFAASACDSPENEVPDNAETETESESEYMDAALEVINDVESDEVAYPGAYLNVGTPDDDGDDYDEDMDFATLQEVEKTGESTYLGFGMDVIGSQALTSKKVQLIKETVYSSMTDGDNTYISSSSEPSTFSTTSVSKSLRETHEKFSVGVEVRTGKSVPFFSGSVKAQYGDQDEVSKEAMYFKSVISATKRQQSFKGNALLPSKLRSFLFADTRKAIDDPNISPLEIFRTYGTHMITAANIGATAEVTAIYNSFMKASKNEVSAALDFSSSYFGATAKTSLSASEKQVDMDTTVYTDLRGGKTMTIPTTNILEIGNSLKEWVGSITTNESALTKIEGTVPIWKLVDSNAKGKDGKTPRSEELEEAFYSYAAACGKALDRCYKESETAEYENNGLYSIRSASSVTKVIDIEGQFKTSKTKVHLWEYGHYNSQKWRIIDSNEAGYVYIQNFHSGLYLDLKQANVSENTPVWQYSVNATDAQKFKIQTNSDGTITIFPKLTRSYALSGIGTNGAEVVNKKYSTSEPAQRWYLIVHA